MFPVKNDSQFSGVDFDVLRNRNGWINNISVLLHFVGLFVGGIFLMAVGFYYPSLQKSDLSPYWILPILIGTMIILPFIFVSLCTLPLGVQRFREYWRFYELHYKIGIKGIKVVFLPIGILGLVAYWKVINAI